MGSRLAMDCRHRLTASADGVVTKSSSGAVARSGGGGWAPDPRWSSATARPGPPPSGGPTPKHSAASSRSTSGTCRATGSHRRAPSTRCRWTCRASCWATFSITGAWSPRMWWRTTTAVRWRSGHTCCIVVGSRRWPWSTWSPWHRGDRTTSAWCATTRTSSRRCPASCTKGPCAPTSPGPATSGRPRLSWTHWSPRGWATSGRRPSTGRSRRRTRHSPTRSRTSIRSWTCLFSSCGALRTPGSRWTVPSGSPS